MRLLSRSPFLAWRGSGPGGTSSPGAQGPLSRAPDGFRGAPGGLLEGGSGLRGALGRLSRAPDGFRGTPWRLSRAPEGFRGTPWTLSRTPDGFRGTPWRLLEGGSGLRGTPWRLSRAPDGFREAPPPCRSRSSTTAEPSRAATESIAGTHVRSTFVYAVASRRVGRMGRGHERANRKSSRHTKPYRMLFHVQHPPVFDVMGQATASTALPSRRQSSCSSRGKSTTC